MEKTYSVIDSRPIHRGRVVDLRFDRVRLPNGRETELEIIRHSGASAMVPLLPDGVVVLIRQFRYAAGGFIYEIPAGRLEPGEAPEACAHRELAEEVGYKAGRLDHLTTIYTTPGFTDERIHIFLAQELTACDTTHEHDEVIEIVKLPLDECLRMIERGEITDGKSIAGLYIAWHRLERREERR